MTFSLHPRLQQDTCPIGTLSLCHILLMNNADYPWLILVPNKADITETTELEEAERIQLMQEISDVTTVMQTVYSPDKMNMGALGNLVPQLHVHLIARYTTDNAWPEPVWGKGGNAYSEKALREHVQIVQTRLAKKRDDFIKADIF